MHARDDGEIKRHVNELYWLANLSGLDVCQKTDYRWVDQLTEAGLIKAGVYQHFEDMPYSADAATLTQAVSAVGSNAAVEVAAQRRLRR